MKLLIFLIFMLLGIGRNLPFQELYFFGLGAADILFCLFFVFLTLSVESRRALLHVAVSLRVPIMAISCLSLLAMISLTFNAIIYGVDGKDFFEILKYFYLLAVMVVTGYCSRRGGAAPALGFVVGVIVSGMIAFLNPMNPDVLGTRQIFNPNVIGNILAVSIIFCSFVIFHGYPMVGGILAVCAAVISFFTFSKGTWLMSAFALIACYLALASPGGRHASRVLKYGKYTRYLVLGSLLYVGYEFWGVIALIVQAKLAATDFAATAAEGGSFSARVGLILSASHMFLMNPILGVGISNFEHVNDLLQVQLGDAYYNDDNPNSAWFYVLGCMGLPAFLFYTLVFFWFLRRVNRAPFANPRIRLIYTVCVGIVFFIGGNVQVEMLTGYYYWVAIGIVAVWSMPELRSLTRGTSVKIRNDRSPDSEV